MSVVEIGLSNSACALVLAVIAAVAGLLCRRPAVVHVLWLLVLIKLLTPPLVHIPLPWPSAGATPPVVAEVAQEETWAEDVAGLDEEMAELPPPRAEGPADAEAAPPVVEAAP